jgi:hypothetical protein
MTILGNGGITSSGNTAALNSGQNGIKVQITGYRIGSISQAEGAKFYKDDVDVDGFVYEGTESDISYAVNDNNSATFTITLDDNVGNFDVGQISLTIAGGVIFCKTVFPRKSPKYKSNLPSSAGNRLVFDIILEISDIQGCIDLTILQANYARIPEVNTENLLPSPDSATYNLYKVINHTLTGKPTLATPRNGKWFYRDFSNDASVDRNILTIDPSKFQDGVTLNSIVYWNKTARKYLSCDAVEYAQGNDNKPIGIRTSLFEITTRGVVKRLNTAGNEWLEFTPTVQYLYCGSAENAGKASVVKSYIGYGRILDNDTVWVDFDNSIDSYPLEGGDLPAHSAPLQYSHNHQIASSTRDGFLSKEDFNRLHDLSTAINGKNALRVVKSGELATVELKTGYGLLDFLNAATPPAFDEEANAFNLNDPTPSPPQNPIAPVVTGAVVSSVNPPTTPFYNIWVNTNTSTIQGIPSNGRAIWNNVTSKWVYIGGGDNLLSASVSNITLNTGVSTPIVWSNQSASSLQFDSSGELTIATKGKYEIIWNSIVFQNDAIVNINNQTVTWLTIDNVTVSSDSGNSASISSSDSNTHAGASIKRLLEVGQKIKLLVMQQGGDSLSKLTTANISVNRLED